MSNKAGKFITFEGIDGSGKSSQISFLQDYLLQNYNIKSIITREPGGCYLSEKLRNIIINEKMDSITELLLLFAARNEHIQTKILPNLNNGIWVLSDRYIDASYAYQNGGRNLAENKITELVKFINAPIPDITFLFDVDINVAKQRIIKRNEKLDKFEAENQNFHLQVKNNYLQQANKIENKNRIFVLDSQQNMQEISQQIITIIQQKFLEVN